MAERLISRGEVYWVDLPDKGGSELKDKLIGRKRNNGVFNSVTP